MPEPTEMQFRVVSEMGPGNMYYMRIEKHCKA